MNMMPPCATEKNWVWENKMTDTTTKTIDDIIAFHGGIDLSDIARSLGGIKRYQGRGISVAEHSILVAALCHKENPQASPELMLACLLHDAAEAYTGDIASPFKELIRRESTFNVETSEILIMRRIYDHLGITNYLSLSNIDYDTYNKRLDIIRKYDLESRKIEEREESIIDSFVGGFIENNLFEGEIFEYFGQGGDGDWWLRLVNRCINQIKGA